ncbi:MAG TPA: hypothetical protein ENH31_08605 [Nitrospirae bacterium]|nr:cytochrome c biogenesis protein Ccs1 [bacterium BMS3Abin10]GBE37731.1 cytochrome c biogenesis protein Ccs1 [bacterium BMS3Bbin08]HDH50896.1 hypothetical protein [Nitrospirota bacterium]HDK82610.1 hypothetical protein [Nitrospirota bacterium]
MLYKLFSSLKTSVYILIFMSFMFLIGTIFPQGGDIEAYIEAGGKYAAVVSALDFLDIFMSPLFIFVTGILVLNLLACLYDRLKLFLKLKRKPIDFEKLKAHPGTAVLESIDIEERLRGMRFKLKTETKGRWYPGVKIYEKGLQYWWLSWFYHVGIILAIAGFFMTALFAVEKAVVLYPDKPETISLYSRDTRWNRFLTDMGMELPEQSSKEEYVLTLKEFRTEYYQGLKIDYPKDRTERFLLGAGLKKIEPSKKGFSYMPRMWLTRLFVKEPDGKVLDAELRVNRPFRTGGLTLYQMGYEQNAKLLVHPVGKKDLSELSNGVKDETIDVEARVPFQVKEEKGKFVLGSFRVGTLFKKDGSTEDIAPFTTLYYIPEDKPSEREVLGQIGPDRSLEAKGITFALKDFKEASYLSYRKDPGVWLVGLACLFVFLGLFIRSLGAWYRVQLAVEGRTAYVLISTRGILADKDRVIKKLKQ